MYYEYAGEITTGKKAKRRLSRRERKAMKAHAEAIKDRYQKAGLM